ncbi:hypothetical protein C9374_004328 [Naegleria lovaniensis]|uniref:Ribosome production factor 2 homolog n=1 Tax=Naegleria lovaniensis TaxID=51637 RepID=A0AA88KJZ5_NAELO|nr:uncharacterized protein C9374_004328 [Naegleria lovaniensis]KAG2383657.1 hypothetical protein C9374_004328 [Naegleria lovaniensis]
MIRKKAKRKATKLLEERKPKVIEDPKKSLILSGRKVNKELKTLLQDLHRLRSPFSTNFTQQLHDLLPFEEVQPLEKYVKSEDTSLFLIGSHTKKRPNNIIMGRCFDHQILDMVEFGVSDLKQMESKASLLNVFGSKPCIIFKGDEFKNNPEFESIRSLFIDFFRMEDTPEVNLLGLDHVISITSLDNNTLAFNHYKINFEKSGQKTPHVELVDIGPSMKLQIRRKRWASDDMKKNAMKVPDVLKKSKDRLKNVFRDELGNVQAKIHVKQQDISTIGTKRYKAMRKGVAEETEKKVDMMEQLNKFLHGKRKYKAGSDSSANGENGDATSNGAPSTTTEPSKKKVKK